MASFRTILKDELARRIRHNPRYSLRAFARDLVLSPSRLSEVLSGKQGLSRSAAQKIAGRLGWKGSEAERFIDLVESQHARSHSDREAAHARIKARQRNQEEFTLELESFRVIADWYHFAILELMQVQDFDSDPRWIARRLGLSTIEVQHALERLARLELIKVDAKGQVSLVHSSGQVRAEIPVDCVRSFLTQIGERALRALHFQTTKERESRARIIAIDRRKVAQAQQAIREFENSFCKEFAVSESKDSLYCLAVQFFDLAGL